MADKAHNLIDEKLEKMEKRLSAIYSRAENEIQKTADEYFSKFKKLDEQKRKLVDAGKLAEDEYLTWRKNKVLYGKRFTQMKEQCAEQIMHVNETAVAYVNSQLPEVYSLGYNALESAVDGVGGYSFTLLDPDTVKNLAMADKSLLPFKQIDPTKDIPWNMKKINAEALQGILQGESMDKIAKRIHNVQEMNKSSAIRTVRTIVTGAENKGRQDSYERAEKSGIVMQREWLATPDMRTRHSHALLDGQLADVDKPFHSELGDIMYPGDPEAAPANVYNCRCTLAAKVLGFNESKRSNQTRADRQNVAEWLEEEREKDPEAFDKAQKMLYNKSADKEQYDNYVSRLGRNNMPKGGFKAFQELKYSNPEEYNDLKAFYRYKGISPESDRRFFEANKAKDLLTSRKEIKAKGVVVKKSPITIVDINIHADQRLNERNIMISEAQSIISNSKFALRQQNGDVFAFYSKKGFAAVDVDGLLRTVGKLDDGGHLLYKEVMKHIEDSK